MHYTYSYRTSQCSIWYFLYSIAEVGTRDNYRVIMTLYSIAEVGTRDNYRVIVTLYCTVYQRWALATTIASS